MIIEDVTDRYESETQAQRDAGDAVASQHDDEDSFHDAAESEDSFEDATEHFDVDALRAAQRRAQAAAEAGELYARLSYNVATNFHDGFAK